MIPPLATPSESTRSLPLTPEAESADFGGVRFTVHRMPNCPDAQVAMTTSLMWRRVEEDSVNPRFRAWGLAIAGNCYTQVDKCEAIWAHVKKGIKFKQDEKTVADSTVPVNPNEVVEVIVRPLDMMGYVKSGCAVGDCDDFSSYAAALLTVNGIECKFATVAADGRDPNQYTHVYVVAYPLVELDDNHDGLTGFRKHRVAVDASHGEYCGWEVPNRYGKYKEWGHDDAFQMVATVLWVGLGAGLLYGLLKGFKF